MKREHKNGIVEILQDDEFYKLYPYLKELSVLSVQEKFVLILTEDGYTSYKPVNRATYTGDTVYSYSQNGSEICSFNKATAEKYNTITLK